jgi:hypothetical protein
MNPEGQDEKAHMRQHDISSNVKYLSTTHKCYARHCVRPRNFTFPRGFLEELFIGGLVLAF